MGAGATLNSVTDVFAHRGYHAEVAENSVAAVAAAVDLGADGVEVDVWLTRDNHLVVTHDRTLGGRVVAASTSRELRALAPVATLGEILEVSAGRRVNVEIKSTRSAAYNFRVATAVAQFLAAHEASPRCLVSSFSLAICDDVRRVDPERRVGWLVHRHGASFVLDAVLEHRLTSAHFPFSRVREPVAARARDEGIELHVWTPNLARDIDRMLAMGVGAVITDDVPVALALRARHDARGVET